LIKDLDLVNSDLTLNSIRILTLISEFESKKSFSMSLNRIMLYDFFMKYPHTMIPSNEITEREIKDFSEHYSYFHWQPDRDEYNLYLRYLLSKNLIEKKIISNDYSFYINQNGKDVLGQMQSSYYRELAKLSKYIKQSLSKLADTKVEGLIIEKLEGVDHE
jgi:hypothetical protein